MLFSNMACPVMLYEPCNISFHLWLEENIIDNMCFVSHKVSAKSIVVSFKDISFPQRTLKSTQTNYFEHKTL
jgi:hypothetical protein